MQKTITLDGRDYSLGTITVEQAEKAQSLGKGIEFNISMISLSLIAGGDPAADMQFVRSLPFFGTFPALLEAALEVNGLKLGEAQPPATAESTSTTSTGS